ncbi:hypothetical protein CHS0354_025965 [Potamilus streckersoni]|uniref:Uncharacterized protein n=1 Tax=Potamilus streckersoni TaxID=2493646 RepID=A0AAE0W6Z2_9BIVA|nr:hypothetical protein CHS0354_025965 [Potamilus streckersoni]
MLLSVFSVPIPLLPKYDHVSCFPFDKNYLSMVDFTLFTPHILLIVEQYIMKMSCHAFKKKSFLNLQNAISARQCNKSIYPGEAISCLKKFYPLYTNTKWT